MKPIPFFITDVFGDRPYSGNQLATFIAPEDLTAAEMQHMAHEIHFSETTFILSRRMTKGGFPVRIFTPAAEVDFAGHPTLGTAFILRTFILRRAVDKITLNLKIGQVPVAFEKTRGMQPLLWMDQGEPRFGKILSSSDFARVLGLRADDIDTRWPVEEVSTGLHHVIVPLRNLNSLQNVRIDRDRYEDWAKTSWAKVILVFCPQRHDKSPGLSVRVFPIALGIQEDPATGSGNGCLAAYLSKHSFFGSDRVDVQVEQGFEINRPSRLFLKSAQTGNRIRVSVGGCVFPIARGTWPKKL